MGVKESFDENKSSKFIPYLDANNLYGWAMYEPLPVGGFQWANQEDFKNWSNLLAFLKLILSILKNCTTSTMIVPLLLEDNS